MQEPERVKNQLQELDALCDTAELLR